MPTGSCGVGGWTFAVFLITHFGTTVCGAESTMLAQPADLLVKPSVGTSVTLYVPAGSVSSFRPSAVNGVCGPALTLNEKSLGGRFEPRTAFCTSSFNGVTVSAVFVIVHTGTVCWGAESTTSLQPSVAVVNPETGASVTL